MLKQIFCLSSSMKLAPVFDNYQTCPLRKIIPNWNTQSEKHYADNASKIQIWGTQSIIKALHKMPGYLTSTRCKNCNALVSVSQNQEPSTIHCYSTLCWNSPFGPGADLAQYYSVTMLYLF